MVDKDEKVDRSAVTELSAVLERLVEEDKVDDKALDRLNDVVTGLNEKTQAAIMDLPVIQRIIERGAVAATDTPGSVITQGIFSRKIPYQKHQVYEKWGECPTFTAPETITVVVPGGWQFRLKEGIIYDTPRNVPPAEVQEDHGYRLPNIVISILSDRAQSIRQNKRETEQRPFGQGVMFLQTGWAGKDQEVAAAAAAPHPAPTQ